MGKKYLDTKKNTLEASILDVWEEAAKLNEYKTKLGEKRRVAGGDMRRTENKKLKEEVELDETTKFSNADFMLGFLVPWAMNPTTKYEPHLVNYVKKLIPANNREYAYKMIAQQLIKLIQGGMPAVKNFARQNKGAYDKMDKNVKKHLMKGMKESTFKEEKHEYEKFFAAAMKKFKINSPADLKSDEEKKKFFDYVDKNYKSSAEKKTGKEDPSEKDKEKIGEDFQKQHEFKMQSMKDAIQKVWEMSDREKIETKRARSVPARPGKTMTGDAASVVTINPKVKD